MAASELDSAMKLLPSARYTLQNSTASAAIHDILGSVIPRPQDRTALDIHTWPHLFAPLPLIVFMAYLARRPNTHYLRLTLLPITILCCLRAGFGFVWLDPRYNNFNYAAALVSVATVSRGLEFGFAAEGIKKVNEHVVGQSFVAQRRYGNLSPKHSSSTSSFDRLMFRPVSNAIELLCSLRGIGFEYGVDIRIPPETRPLDRGPFLRATVILFLRSFLLLDIIESLAKYTPPLRTPLGCSIFMPSLPIFQRYAISTFIHIATGCGVMEGFHIIYHLCSVIDVGLLNNTPTAWPPIFDHPWRSHSLHDFWARRWHQVLRRVFMVFGGLPGRWIGGRLGDSRVGMLFGTFIASGLFHEIPAYAMGKGLDWRVPAFFLLHAFLILGERLWRWATGKKVGGWWGRIWTYFAIIVLGQILVDSWHTRGIGGAMIIPPVISPVRRMFLPAVFRLMDYLDLPMSDIFILTGKKNL